MKTFFTLLAAFFVMSSSLFAQGVNKVGPQQFWDSNVLPIIEGDMEKVVSQTNFPLTTFDGEWSEKEFVDGYDLIFDESVLAVLETQTFRDIQSFEDDGGEMIYMVVINVESEFEGETYESALLLSFMKFEGEWKLYDIGVAG